MATSKKPTPKKPSAPKKSAAKKTGVKKATKKTVAKKVGKKASAKKVAKKKTVKKTAAKKVAKKKVVKKTAKKKVAKKTVKKSAAKKATKKTAKKTGTAKKTAKKKTTAKKTAKKAVVRKKTSRKPAASGKAAAAETPGTESAEAALMASLMEVEAKKFEIDSRRPESASPPTAPRELDEAFHETRVTLLVRDPEWIFIYWEIDDETRERHSIQRTRSDKRIVLRWYDVTDLADFDGTNAHHVMDVEVNDAVSSWYQHLPETGRSWCADLGSLTADGTFHVVCRSNFVHTPTGRMHEPRGEETWMRVVSETSEQGVYRTPSGTAPTQAEIGESTVDGRVAPPTGTRGVRLQRGSQAPSTRPATAAGREATPPADPEIRHELNEGLSSADLLSSMRQDSSGFAEELRRRINEDE